MNLTDKEINFGYLKWRIEHGSVELDTRLKSEPKDEAWLKDVRLALRISAADMARRLEISREAYSTLEEREIAGAITINSLRKVADALGCEFHYYVRPKKYQTFSAMLWNRIFAKIKGSARLKICDPKRRGDVLGYLAMCETPKLRKRYSALREKKRSPNPP